MSDFEFSPPHGSIHVRYSDLSENKTESGIHLPVSKPKPIVSGTVTAIGGGIEGISIGDTVWFDRTRSFKVADGTFSVEEGNIEGIGA